MKCKIIHGPNLNLLGTREPSVYGVLTLNDVNHRIEKYAAEKSIDLEIIQSNHEGEIIDAIHSSQGIDGIVINPAGYGHTSVAILDALKAVGLPFVEVHLSNIHAREEFRHHTYTSAAAVGVVMGFGADSYILGIEGLLRYLMYNESKIRNNGRK